jgi:hypothetical protein
VITRSFTYRDQCHGNAWGSCQGAGLGHAALEHRFRQSAGRVALHETGAAGVKRDHLRRDEPSQRVERDADYGAEHGNIAKPATEGVPQARLQLCALASIGASALIERQNRLAFGANPTTRSRNRLAIPSSPSNGDSSVCADELHMKREG